MTGPLDGARIVQELERKGRALGFSMIGVAGAQPSSHLEHYRRWLANGGHGEMRYLARADHVARRGDLGRTMDAVRSVVVVAHEYFVSEPPEAAADPSRAVIARYARGEDYHRVLERKLLELRAWLDDRIEGGVRGRAYVDTGPILERELAQRAGLGWFGRNTMLISPTRGSYFVLGVLLLDVTLPASAPFEEDRCGTCRACLDACPTGALLGRDETGAPRIDARRCISYLTIELRGTIPVELRSPMGNRVFGCDICQEVCPWNERFAEPTREPAYEARPSLDGPDLVAFARRLLDMSERAYQREFADSPLERPRRKGMLRNLCVALGNWGAAEAVPVLRAALRDQSPLVRGHAAWALGRVGSSDAIEALVERLTMESEQTVRDEIAGALERG